MFRFRILSVIFCGKLQIDRVQFNFLMHWPFSKYNNVSFFLFFIPKLSTEFVFLVQSFLFQNLFSYEIFEVRLGHRVGINLSFFLKKLQI